MKDGLSCYSCRFRGSLPGDAHSCCRHPDLKGATDDPLAGILAMLASVGRGQPVVAVEAALKKFDIQAKHHGIKMGWFNWPWNFDPVWLLNCNAFEEKLP